MYNRHSEKREARGDTEVFVFDGDPVEWEYKRVEPYLVQAFAASDDGKNYSVWSWFKYLQVVWWSSIVTIPKPQTTDGFLLPISSTIWYPKPHHLLYSPVSQAFASPQFMEQHGKSNRKIKLIGKACKTERRSFEPRIQNKFSYVRFLATVITETPNSYMISFFINNNGPYWKNASQEVDFGRWFRSNCIRTESSSSN